MSQILVFGHSRQTLQAPKTWETYKFHTVVARNEGIGYNVKASLALPEEHKPEYGLSFQNLDVSVEPQTAERLHIKITPDGHKRWEVPESIVSRPTAAKGLHADSLLYEVQQPSKAAASAGQPFALTVVRKETGQPIFDTRGHSFLFKDQLIELTTNVPEDSDLYGLGEVTLPGGLLLPRDGTIFTMWARDMAASATYVNLYGTHPFYLQVNKDGTSQGVFFLNSNGMDVILNKTSVTFRSIGGLVDLCFFLGPSPEAVIRQYHEVIGTTMMPPYWALGAHQGKFGYANLSVVEEMVANYSAAQLPLEGVWLDIEMFDNLFNVFTFDKDHYPAERMRKFVERLQANGQHWAPIFNPGISVTPGYKPFDEGTAEGLWINDVHGNPYYGQMWPGLVHYPSFLYHKTGSWLKSQLRSMHHQVPFDGMWLDVNEADNFCSGMVCQPPKDNKNRMWVLEQPTPRNFNASSILRTRLRCQLYCTDAPLSNKQANPPYKINNFGWKGGASNNGLLKKATDGQYSMPLDLKGISVTARHPDGTSEYDAHNLYGTAMAKQFHSAYSSIPARDRCSLPDQPPQVPGATLVIGRMTVMTGPRFTFTHLAQDTATGDTRMSWEGLREATSTILSANMWGLAMTGADICGFGIEGKPRMTAEEFDELCSRLAGATAAAKKAYGLRYRLLTYIYGSLYLAHKRGGTLARPLLFTDPADLKARNATWQWMLGEALLVSPVLTKTTNTINPYFTAGAWYSAWDYRRLDSTGNAVRMDVPLGHIAVHLRGGTIVPYQHYAPVTRDVRFSPITLVVALPSSLSQGTQHKGIPLPPYALEQHCADAHTGHSGKLVSCGLLYADNDAQEVSEANSVQAWLTAVTAPNARSGSIFSSIKAASPGLKDKLHITEVHIIGLPAEQQQTNNAQEAKQQTAAAPAHAASAERLSRLGGHQAGTASGFGQTGSSQLSHESMRVAGPDAAIATGQATHAGKAVFDASIGVLKISGIDLLLSEEFTLQWHL